MCAIGQGMGRLAAREPLQDEQRAREAVRDGWGEGRGERARGAETGRAGPWLSDAGMAGGGRVGGGGGLGTEGKLEGDWGGGGTGRGGARRARRGKRAGSDAGEAETQEGPASQGREGRRGVEEERVGGWWIGAGRRLGVPVRARV